MKKVLIALFAIMPFVSFAQSNTTLTPEQQLEKARRQLEAAQKAVAEGQGDCGKASCDSGTDKKSPRGNG